MNTTPGIVGQGSSPKKRVLLVEDEDFTRTLLSMLVEEYGYEVQAMDKGLDAILALRTGSYAALITDLSMPDFDGWAVAREARKYSAKIKIVLFSGYENCIKPPEPNLVDLIIGKSALINIPTYLP